MRLGDKVCYTIDSYEGCGILTALVGDTMVRVDLGIWAGAYIVLPISEVRLCN